ncbi:MAG: restriction endonuclease subunit S [Faecalibacterium prausnitzii]
MKSEWNTSAIANICKVVTDGSHTSPKSVSHGKYMVSVKDFTPYGFDFNGCRQISFADYEKLKSSGCVPQKGDILIGKDGARYFEDIIIYNQDEAPALLSSIAILRCDEEKVIPEYLYYLLKTPSFKKDVKDNYGSGSAIPRIILKDFKRMKVEYPSIEKQRQIVSILHDLDAKIFNNQKVNDNLEQQAKELFRAWFVEFIPFGGTMPSDWHFRTLGESTEMSAGGDKPKILSSIQTEKCTYPVYSNGLSDEGLYGYTDAPKIKDESVTVSARGTIGFVCLRHIPYVPIVRLVTLIPLRKLMSAKYLYLYLKQCDISGTGTTQQQLTVPDFRKTEILIPSKDVMDQFTKTVTPLFDTIWSNQEQNRKLASLRDILLPKLMSGELNVSDIQL